MTASTSSVGTFTTPAFWERFWHTSGIQFVLIFIIAYIIYGYQPQVGASADALVAFYDGMRTFPRAMFIMAGTFGLWRAGLISNALFAAGVAALVLVLLGGTTWMSEGFWTPASPYSRFVSPIIGLV